LSHPTSKPINKQTNNPRQKVISLAKVKVCNAVQELAVDKHKLPYQSQVYNPVPVTKCLLTSLPVCPLA